MNTILIEALMTHLRKRGTDESNIRSALECCWIYATGEAFYMPDFAFDKMDQPDRKVYAEHIFEAMVVQKIEEKVGGLSPEDINHVIDASFNMERLKPFMRLDKGDSLPWIVGKRSNN